MTDWVDYILYAGMIVTYWFIFASWSSRFTHLAVEDRNPDWLAAHSSFATQWTGSHWFLWSCYAWGALSLAVLSAYQFGVWPGSHAPQSRVSHWMALKDINSAMLIVGLVFYFGCVAIFTRRLTRDVPLAERRTASLERRSLDDFIPPLIRWATYGLLGIHLVAWIWIGVFGWSATPGYWARFVAPIVFSAIFYFFAQVSVHRPPSVMDRILGASYRRGEVRFSFAMILCVNAMYALRLYLEVTHVPDIEIERVLHLGIVLLITIGVLRFAFFSRPHKPPIQRPSLQAST